MGIMNGVDCLAGDSEVTDDMNDVGLMESGDSEARTLSSSEDDVVEEGVHLVDGQGFFFDSEERYPVGCA